MHTALNLVLWGAAAVASVLAFGVILLMRAS